MSKKFSHLDENGNPNMVDISSKTESKRIAIAYTKVKLNSETLNLIIEDKIQKGNVIQVANIAGIQASKKTHELIPLCHPLDLSYVKLKFNICNDDNSIEIISEACTVGKTGVEMEALIAASTAALTRAPLRRRTRGFPQLLAATQRYENRLSSEEQSR